MDQCRAEASVSAIDRRLLFVGGKGGVGKTVVSQAIAQAHAEKGLRTLWVTFEDPTRPMGELKQITKTLWHLNCEATSAFEEYAALKIGMPALTRIFLKNKLMRYLSQAAPGIHELVLLGKVWYERDHYDRVVIDMPSTGYGLAMFQSTDNFARLFKGGPIHKDAEAMLSTFRDPAQTGHAVVSLPEEMPLVESLELNDYLGELFPANPAALFVNKRFPSVEGISHAEDLPEPPHTWENPLATSALDYARKRYVLEAHNLRLWQERGLKYTEIEAVPPPPDFNARGADPRIVTAVTRQLQQKGIA
jgi:anion-transporting  ArsA/GET3 family ATPase